MEERGGHTVEERTIDNQLKYENYKEQFRRLNKALANGFNLEAMFIEYAIIEDRTESVLRHGGYWDAYLKKRGNGRSATINSKISYIQRKIESGDKLLAKYFFNDLLNEILTWKEERNRLIHALLKQQLAHCEVRSLAEQGNKLVKKLRSCSANYNRAIERTKRVYDDAE